MTIIVQSIDVSFGCVKLSSAYLSTVLSTCQDFSARLSVSKIARIARLAYGEAHQIATHGKIIVRAREQNQISISGSTERLELLG
jgi:hypothetical protein